MSDDIQPFTAKLLSETLQAFPPDCVVEIASPGGIRLDVTHVRVGVTHDGKVSVLLEAN